MRSRILITGLTTFFLFSQIASFAQLKTLFAPIDCREHADWFHEEAITEIIIIDSSLLLAEIPWLSPEAVEAWQQWTIVQNFTFGKDRGSLSMITDLNALHPYFRDKIRELIAQCKRKGINLAIVETYRTHAKQNEYKAMGKKYTNSTGGKSKHQYGLAVDLVPIVDSVAVWDNKVLWTKVGTIGENLGLRWGGRWKKLYDPGHFEWTGGLTSSHLAVGIFPDIPIELYPDLETELTVLREYWKEWEIIQSSSSRKPSTPSSALK